MNEPDIALAMVIANEGVDLGGDTAAQKQALREALRWHHAGIVSFQEETVWMIEECLDYLVRMTELPDFAIPVEEQRKTFREWLKRTIRSLM